MRSKWMRVLFCVFLSIALVGCGEATNTNEKGNVQSSTLVSKSNQELAKEYDASVIELDDTQILVDGTAISDESTEAVYAAKDIVFYLEGQDFTYGEGTKEDEHSQEEADAHTVVHITQPGNYVVSGKLSAGQLAVDLGEDAKEDENAVVTLILNNADITCSVAPAVIFYNVYECGSDNADEAVKDVDTSEAGANVIIADGSENSVNGSYVARIYKSVELNEDGTEVIDSKKLHKYDAAFYSKRSMNMNGETENTGILNIKAENEGLDSELHLTINGGNINITSGNDGINTNEDGVSVTTINGGNLTIMVDGSTGEGDGIDSNGWLVINGGSVTAMACSFSMDGGIDSDMGIHINGGNVLATGNMLDGIADSTQNYVVFRFDETQKAGSLYELKNAEGTVVANRTLENDFSIMVFSGEELNTGTYTLWKDGTQLSLQESGNNMMGGMRPGMPGNGEFSEMPFMNENGEFPQMPEGEMWKEGELPQMPEGEMWEEGEIPQMPEGEMWEEGELPQMSEGEMSKEGEFSQWQKGQRPQNMDGEDFEMPNGKERPNKNGDGFSMNAESGETVTEFSIKEGGNMFRVITEE